LRDARPDLPDAFVAVVERAIDPDPRRRFQSAGDLHASLEKRDPITRPHSVLLEPPSVPAAATLPSTQYRPLTYASVATLAVAFVWVCGFVASRTLEVALHIDPDFGASAADHLTFGLQGLVPFAVFWLLGMMVVLVFTGIRRMLGATGDRLLHPVRQRIQSISPMTMAAGIPTLAALSFFAITWWHWPMFDALAALQRGDAVTAAGAPVLGPAFHYASSSYTQLASAITFVLILAAWRWWPGFERRSDDVSTVRVLKAASIALAVVIVLCAVAPRRLAFERFAFVMFQNRPSFVIGTKDEELLLFVTNSVGTVRPHVRRDSGDVTFTRERRSITLWDTPLDAPDPRR
jgi:hypothetical protein